MTTPKNNLAEQMAALTKRNDSLKNLLKRKRKSEPITSQSKRPSDGGSENNSPSLSNSLLTKSFPVLNSPLTERPSDGNSLLTETSPLPSMSHLLSPKVPSPNETTRGSDISDQLSSFVDKPERDQPNTDTINLDSDSEEFFCNGEEDDFEIPTRPSNTPQKQKKSPFTSPQTTLTRYNGKLQNTKQSENSVLTGSDLKSQKKVYPSIIPEELSFIALSDRQKPEFEVNSEILPKEEPDGKFDLNSGILPKEETHFSAGAKFDTPSYGNRGYENLAKSDNSFAETVTEFNLLGAAMTSTQVHPQAHTNNVQRIQSTKLSSPDKGSCVLVKVQPSKSEKRNLDPTITTTEILFKGWYDYIIIYNFY